MIFWVAVPANKADRHCQQETQTHLRPRLSLPFPSSSVSRNGGFQLRYRAVAFGVLEPPSEVEHAASEMQHVVLIITFA